MKQISPFEKPIYVTRPMLANLEIVSRELQEIWESQWLTNAGAKHNKLEEELIKVLKVPALSLFNNGETALLVGVRSLQLSGEVITTPFTFPGTPHVLVWNNLSPVFCDIDETMTLDPGRIEAAISPRTTGILGVHVYGMPCNVQKIQEIASRNFLKVVYDAAHAFNTEIDGVGIGTFGDLSMFSFHATKLFHTIEGGALAFSSPDLKRKVDLLKNFGIKNEDEVISAGINGKMNELQASIGLINLQLIESERKKREKIVDAYTRNLAGIAGITVFEIPQNVKKSYQYFVIRISSDFGRSRDEVYSELKKYNVFARKYFYPLCSDYEFYRDLPSSQPENLPMANRMVKEVLCMPLYGNLKLDEVDKICEIIKGFKN